MAGTTFSDHVPISITILQEKRRAARQIRITDAIIKEERSREHLKGIWEKYDILQGPNVEKFMSLLQESKLYLIQEAKDRYHQYKSKEKALARSLISLQKLQEVYPWCDWTESLLKEARMEIQDVQQSRSDFVFQRLATKWVQVGDKVTKEFFECTAPKYSRAPIQALRDENGNRVTDSRIMLSIATTFYRKLLTAEEVNLKTSISRQKIWDHVKKTVIEEMIVKLICPITEMELKEAMRAIPKSSCPGEDGLSISFFEVNWDIIGGKLAETCNEIFQTGNMP